jgi:rSAM/selenodomain-associated transferase 2
MPAISIIMPVLNEAPRLAGLLAALAPLRQRGAELILVDGGSTDGGLAIAQGAVDRLVQSPRGRAVQMNAGAAQASGEILLFLHVDTQLPDNADRLIIDGLKRSGQNWGRFDVRIEGRHPLLPMVAGMMNWRSRLTGIATGDQAIFVTRSAFEQIGGYRNIALMEDIELSRALKKRGAPLCLQTTVTTSGRRWDEKGFWRVVLLMWRLRLAHFCGVDPDQLARDYGYAPRT